MTLPDFNDDGVLPPGDYVLTIEELKRSTLVAGPSGHPDWDAEWRGHLVDNLEILVFELSAAGITEIFIDGSFVESKGHPNDIDGYFVCEESLLKSGKLQRTLNDLNPYQVWTWDSRRRSAYPGSSKTQLPMWHRYRVELYPHYGQGSGIIDEFGYELKFPAAFRRSRRGGKPRGIIKVSAFP